MTKVDRYDFRSKHHGTEVVVKSREGKWVKASDYDALTADNARLRQKIQNQTDQINGLERSRRRLESLMAGADRRVAAVEAERDQAWKMAAEADTRLGQTLGNTLQDKADNARLRAELTKAADSLDWADAHLEDAGVVSANVRYGARDARAALTGKETK
jgi:chromosome segregation ATPase